MIKRCIFGIIIAIAFISPVLADPAENYEKAFKSFNDKAYDDAYIHLKNVLQEDPEHLPGKILLGKIYLNSELYEPAIAEFHEALSSGADINLILKPMAEALLRTRKYREVLKLAEERKLNTQTQFDNHLVRSDAFISMERMDEAFRELQQATHLFPQNIKGLNALISFHLRTNQRKKARELVHIAHDVSTENGTTWFLLGQLEKDEGNALGALNAYKQALTLMPEDNRTKRALASINLQLGDLTNAEAMINSALTDKPDDPLAILVKSRLLQLNNDAEQATAILNEMNQKLSLATDEYLSKNSWVYFIRGLSSHIIGNHENALNDLTTYIQEEPNHYNAVNLLVETYTNLGENRLAISLLERYIDQVDEDLELSFSLRLCDLYLIAGRHFRCSDIIDKLNKKYPNNAQVLIAQSRSMVSQGKYREALEFIKTAYARDKNNDIGHYLAKLFLITEQYQDALIFTNHLLNQQPDNIELLNVKGESLIKLGALDEASNTLNDLLNLDNYYFPALMNLADIDLLKGNYKKAKKSLEFIIANNPPHAGASSLLSEAEAQLGNMNASIQALQDYLQRRPEDIEVKKLLIKLLSRSGRSEEALTLLETGTDNNKFDEDYLTAKAELLLALEDIEGVREQHRILYTVWQNEPEKLLTLSRMQRRIGNIGLAQRTISTALKQVPNNKALLIEQIKLATLAKDFQQAKQKLDALKNASPDWSEIWNIDGDFLLATKAPKKAQTSYAKAFELSGSSNGLILLKLYNLAIDGYSSSLFEQQAVNALNRSPNNHYFRNLLADYLLLNNRFSEAREHYLALTKVAEFPNKSSLYNNLALATMRQNLDEAFGYSERAAKLNPSSANVMDTYGWLLAKKEQYPEALRALRVAYTISSVNPYIRYHLGHVLNQLGRKDEAIVELQVAVATTEEFTDKGAAQELLTSLTNK
jgi:putative PEP-CTERM system TPR-repeat lipoprotein